MAKKVLVVDDEKLIVKGIRFSLEQDGMEVDCAYDGEEALRLAAENTYDMILLDIMLPKMGGFEVCQQIREFSMTPIVMLTAKGDDMDKILGLEYGADDYITKPFNILEVKARIKAIMRRTSPMQRKGEETKEEGTAADAEQTTTCGCGTREAALQADAVAREAARRAAAAAREAAVGGCDCGRSGCGRLAATALPLLPLLRAAGRRSGSLL